MGYAQVTKHSNLRHTKTDNTSVTTDANIPDEWTLPCRFYYIVPLQVMQLMQT